MDAIASHLSPIASRVAVPRSVPGLVTRRVMAMTFMEGTPLMQLQDKVAHLPKWKRERVGLGGSGGFGVWRVEGLGVCGGACRVQAGPRRATCAHPLSEPTLLPLPNPHPPLPRPPASSSATSPRPTAA
jgi:hypothetical protein